MSQKKTSMKPKFDFDAIVIGTGPGGEGAAMYLAKSGRRVAAIERYQAVGGGCTHWGTIPSKALRHSVSRLIEFNENPLFQVEEQMKGLTFSQILRHAAGVIRKQVRLRSGFYDRNLVKIYQGEARFIDSHTLEITHTDGSSYTLSAETIVIATGSRPYRPPQVDFNHPRIYDSDTILSLDHDPRHIIIFGAGVIGCEYASIFRGLGVRVDLVNTRAHLLDFLDAEISDALSYHLREQGATIRHDEHYARVEADDHGVTLHLQSGKSIRADVLLWCNGRTGNSERLGLETAGLSADGRGHLSVDDRYQTACEGIYAVGDLIGWPSLASAAYDQGRFCAGMICGDEPRQVTDVPTGIYTIPGISSVGKTEQELTRQQVPYEVGQAFFRNLARAQITAEKVGVLKILFHRDTLAVLGIHCFGYQATEIVHVGQAIMRQPAPNNSLNYFLETTFNYPTMAEAYRVAAINGMNRLRR